MSRVRRGGAVAALGLLAILATAALGQPASPAAKSGEAAAAPTIPATIGLTPDFAALEEGMGCDSDRRGNLYLTVENAGRSELRVTSVSLLAPADLELCKGAGLPATVAAGSRQVLAVPVGTSRALRPGTTPLLLQIGLRTNVDGTRVDDVRLASDEVELRIRGLSDILKLVGVPTLFLLPGVLVLGAFFLAFPIEGNRIAPYGLGFWIVAISVSLVLSVIYYLLTWLSGEARDLTQRFSLADVGLVWAGSVSLGGALGFGTGLVVDRARRKADAREAKLRADRTFTGEEDPQAVLDKLAALGTAWPLDWYGVGDRTGFLVQTPAGQRWLIPQAEATPDRPAAVAEADWKAGRRALYDLVRSEPPLDQLRERLKTHPIAALGPLVWKGDERPERIEGRQEARKQDDRWFIETQ